MKLHDRIKVENVSIAEYGRRIGVSDRSVMRRYALGLVLPPPEVVAAIYLESGGTVTPNDFYELPAVDAESAAA